MKTIKMLIISGVFVLAINGIAFSGDTHSGKAIEQAGKAGSHGSASAAHAIVGSGQVTSAASAVPLSVAGSVGAVSTEVANELMDAATAPIGAPLEITDESVTAGPPPNEVLKINKKTDL